MVEKQEYLQRFSQLQQQSKQLQEQVEQVNQRIQEFETLKDSINKIRDSENNEMLAPVGRGIFFKSEKKEEKLFVNVGSNVMVKRKPDDAKKIVDKQIDNMNEIKQELTSQIESINSQFQKMMTEIQGQQD